LRGPTGLAIESFLNHELFFKGEIKMNYVFAITISSTAVVKPLACASLLG
jgi:hypothetical protein